LTGGDLLFEEVDPYNLHVEVELLFEDYLLQMDEVSYILYVKFRAQLQILKRMWKKN
jgi:hypothetical protein